MNDERMSSRNRLRSTAVTGGLMSVAVLSVSAPALADDLGYIADSLESSNIYASSNTSNVPTGLNKTYDSSIAIVFVDESSNTMNDAANLMRQTNYETVIVSVNGKSFGAASNNGNGAAIAEHLNSQGTGAEALITEASTIQEMASGTGLITSTETGTTSPIADSGIGIGAGIGLGLGAVLIITVGIVLVKKLFGKKSADEKPFKDVLPEEYFNNISQKLGQEVSRLRELIAKHEKAELPLSSQRLVAVDKRLGDLFTRLAQKGTQEQTSIAAVKYQDLLKKIIYIMDEGHYMDLAKNPELWNHAERRKQDSLNCVEAVDEQILDNIRQLNDSQDLEFNITMQALLSDSDDMDEIEELLFKDGSSGYRDFRK